MIYCDADYDNDGDFAWIYTPASDLAPLATKRSRRCCSCKTLIKPGQDALHFERHREPRDEVEERIYYDGYVPLASWYLCETCAGLWWAVGEAGFCCELGEDIAQQIREYREEENAYWRRQKVSDAALEARKLQAHQHIGGSHEN